MRIETLPDGTAFLVEGGSATKVSDVALKDGLVHDTRPNVPRPVFDISKLRVNLTEEIFNPRINGKPFLEPNEDNIPGPMFNKEESFRNFPPPFQKFEGFGMTTPEQARRHKRWMERLNRRITPDAIPARGTMRLVVFHEQNFATVEWDLELHGQERVTGYEGEKDGIRVSMYGDHIIDGMLWGPWSVFITAEGKGTIHAEADCDNMEAMLRRATEVIVEYRSGKH